MPDKQHTTYNVVERKPTADDLKKAKRTVAHHARNAEEAKMFLEQLGLLEYQRTLWKRA